MHRREEWLDKKMGIENQGVDRVPRRGQEATFHHQFLLRVVVYDLLRQQTTISLLDYSNRRLWQPFRNDVTQDTYNSGLAARLIESPQPIYYGNSKRWWCIHAA